MTIPDDDSTEEWPLSARGGGEGEATTEGEGTRELLTEGRLVIFDTGRYSGERLEEKLNQAVVEGGRDGEPGGCVLPRLKEVDGRR